MFFYIFFILIIFKSLKKIVNKQSHRSCFIKYLLESFFILKIMENTKNLISSYLS